MLSAMRPQVQPFPSFPPSTPSSPRFFLLFSPFDLVSTHSIQHQPSGEFSSSVTKSTAALDTAMSEFLIVAQSIARLAAQRSDVLEQQMGDAAEVSTCE